jgi:SAM-dependent methyltransferase
VASGSPAQVADLYTKSTGSYPRFVRAILYPQGIRAYLRGSAALRDRMRVLDAGCGTGIVTFALRDALAARGFSATSIDAFDLTPAMLDVFRSATARRGVDVRIAQADVLELDTLPDDWRGHDLIVSSAMLEYVEPDRLTDALAGLRERLAPGGRIVVFITRDNWLTRPMIGAWWRSNVYSEADLHDRFEAAGYSSVTFGSFPGAFRYLSIWGHVIEAHGPAATEPAQRH